MYGWTHKEIGSLTVKQFWAYRQQAVVMIAENQLMEIEAQSYCHMDDNSRRKVHGKYMAIIDTDYNDRQVRQSMAKLDGLMGKFGYKGNR